MNPGDAPTRFRVAHAADPNWRTALELCFGQLEGQTRVDGHAQRANLGFVYLSDAYAPLASEILTFLKVRTGVVDWVGTVGVGVCANGAEYFDEGAMAIMLAELPSGSFSVFSGEHPPPALFERTPSGALAAHAALVHADPATPDLADLVLDMAHKVESGWLFGGLSSSRGAGFQIANRTLTGAGRAANVYGSALSGVVFSSEVHLVSRVTQGCHPLAGPASAAHAITACEGSLIRELDGRPALDVLLDEVGAADPAGASRLGQLAGGLFAGLSPADLIDARFGDLLMRQVIALDPQARTVGVAAAVEPGQRLTFCTRNARAAHADLVRICAELRDEVEHEEATLGVGAGPADAVQARVRGAVYVSCLGRGAQLFGRRGAELRLIREQLGDVPLVGFFASGEIARNQLHGHTGVLTLFL